MCRTPSRALPAGRRLVRAGGLALLLSPLLGSCAAGTAVPVAGGLGIDIAVFHRDLFDMLVSGVTGRDCSVVRLDRGETYCKPIEPPTPPIPYCTRSLGVVDCWLDPALVPDIGPELADGPRQLTPIQERDRTAPWPHLF